MLPCCMPLWAARQQPQRQAATAAGACCCKSGATHCVQNTNQRCTNRSWRAGAPHRARAVDARPQGHGLRAAGGLPDGRLGGSTARMGPCTARLPRPLPAAAPLAAGRWGPSNRMLSCCRPPPPAQSRMSEVFAVDIHPAARFGRGILIDHGEGANPRLAAAGRDAVKGKWSWLTALALTPLSRLPVCPLLQARAW